MNGNQAQLRAVLANPDHCPTIKILLGDKVTITTLDNAREMIRRGEYQWAGTARRCKQMRLVATMVDGRPTVKSLPWVGCLRNTGSASIQPSIEWLRGMYGEPA